ncbi:hypothetical protein AB0C51_23985 [Streptomyces pathocidini]|uniref:Lipoprotein CseA n=1 Tax=Streptomyces pathocidini TaxID=1650571 RepID=A0ABW7URU5_9ACTN|nr:hypothetical protein [Streptomyces pathocidini]
MDPCSRTTAITGIAKTVTAAALAAAVGLFVSGCTAGAEGVRMEGPAPSKPPTPSSSLPSSAPAVTKVDAVQLLKTDPKVSAEIRKDLKPCVADEYPVDVSYGRVTGSSGPDVVVNVLTCGDAIGIGTYVYREAAAGKKYENVFVNEQPPVYGEISRGDLEVTRQVYGPGDPVSFPSGEDVVTYRWSGGRFVESARTHNEYSKSVTGDSPSAAPKGG